MGRLLSTHIQHLIITGAGVTPTIPSPVTSSPSDSTWVAATDIMQGEWAYNITDGIWYYRNGANSIVAFASMPASVAASDFLIGNGTTFVKKTLAETKTILDLPYDTDLADSATIALDLTSRRDGISSGNSTQTATTITLSNIPTKGVRHISIGKTNAADLVVTLAGTNMQFEFFDSTNNCYTTGTNCTLSAGAGTSFAISLVFTGLTSGANARIQVAGTFNAFS